MKLDKQAPIKKMNGQYQRQLPRPINSNINECTWCFASLSKLTDFKKIQHIDNCKYKLIQNCLICSRNLANLNEYNRKTHIEFCRIRNEKKKLANKKSNEKNQTGLDKNSKQTKTEEKNVKKNGNIFIKSQMNNIKNENEYFIHFKIRNSKNFETTNINEKLIKK